MEPITRHVTALQIRKAYGRASKDTNIQFAEHLVITDWTDYDEKAQESVGIYEVTHQFVKC